MINRYLITVKDKNELSEIEKLGSITHVAKLNNLITLESLGDITAKAISLDNVIDIKESEIMKLDSNLFRFEKTISSKVVIVHESPFSSLTWD